MLRILRTVLLIGAVFVMFGCNEEVKEIPASEEGHNTPEMSEAKKKELMEGENKREKEGLEKREAAKKKKKKGAKDE